MTTKVTTEQNSMTTSLKVTTEQNSTTFEFDGESANIWAARSVDTWSLQDVDGKLEPVRSDVKTGTVVIRSEDSTISDAFEDARMITLDITQDGSTVHATGCRNVMTDSPFHVLSVEDLSISYDGRAF